MQIQIIEHFLVITLHCLHFCVHVTAYNPTLSMASVVNIWPDPLTDHGLARFKSMCSIPKNRKPLSTFSSNYGVLNSDVFQICHCSIYGDDLLLNLGEFKHSPTFIYANAKCSFF